MNLERLHRIFGSGSNLKRDDIRSYGKTSDEHAKHIIEEKAMSNSFNADAMEGWEKVNYDVDAMSRVDKKFKPKSNNIAYILGSVTILAIIFASFYMTNNASENLTSETTKQNDDLITGLKEDQQITLDQSDLLIPELIEQMVVAPKKEQVQLAEIKHDFAEKKNLPENEMPIDIESLPMIEIVVDEEVHIDIERVHDYAKEIYLFDLKLVDYRKYRSNPTIKTKQITLTGIPANKEHQDSQEMEPEWKVVHIPYTEFLSKSIKIFGKGQYKRSLTRFETILETYSDDVNANFYGGLCLFNLKEYEQGINLFNSCIVGPYSNFDEEAQWLIALSHEKLGNINEAKKIYKSIITQNGYYKSQAADKLK